MVRRLFCNELHVTAATQIMSPKVACLEIAEGVPHELKSPLPAVYGQIEIRRCYCPYFIEREKKKHWT